MEDWIDTKIRDFFSSSMPGDWGTDGNPENGVPVLRSTNFRNNGSIDYSDITYRKVEEARLNKRRVVKGTILIEKSGGSPSQAAGRVVYCDREFNGTASNFIEVVKVKDDFSSRYVAFLLYYLYQVGTVLKYQQQTTGIINFKLNEYSEEKVTCPASKPEQAKIAEILSTVDRAIEQTEALIAKQQRIKTGLMQDLLTRGIDEHGNLRSEQTHQFKHSPLGRIPVEWEVQRVLETGSVTLGRQLAPKYMVGKSPTPYLRVANVFDGWIDFHDILEMDFTPPEKERFFLCSGDILLNEGQSIELVGRSSIFFGPDNVFCFQNTLLRYRVFEGTLPTYARAVFKWWLDTGAFQEVSRQTTSVAHLGADRFAQMLFLRPPVNEQERIMESMLAHESQMKAERDFRAKLRAIKTGLMQDLLTGKKRVTELLEPSTAS